MSQRPLSAKIKLKKLRRQIDLVDRLMMQILARRFRVVSEIGRLKKKHSLPIVQNSRMREMLKGRRADAARLNLDAKLVYEIFDLLHVASIQAQEKILVKIPRKKRGASKRSF